MASNNAEKITYPPLPENPSYADVDPADLPPQAILEASKKLFNGKETIFFRWVYEEDLKGPISEFELYVYEETDEPHDPSRWKCLHVEHLGPLPTKKIPVRVFTPNRRYFFSIRCKDSQCRYGPYSAPIFIDA